VVGAVVVVGLRGGGAAVVVVTGGTVVDVLDAFGATTKVVSEGVRAR
jgi:hypothetical protein